MKDVPSGIVSNLEAGAKTSRSAIWRYAIALLSITAALILRWILNPVLENNFPFITLYGAVAIAVWYGRWQPAVLASIVGYFVARDIFISPDSTASFTTASEIAGITAYALSCGFIIYFGERMHRTNDRLLQLFQSTNILEDTLAKEKELLATTLASIGDAVIVTDSEGRITSINTEAERLTGWKNSEAVQKPLTDVFRIIDERSRRPAENPVERAFRDGTIVGLANHTVLISRDGREIPIDDNAAPIYR